MKACPTATCVVFGLIPLAHIARATAEGLHATPSFLPSTAIAKFGWGLRLRKRGG